MDDQELTGIQAESLRLHFVTIPSAELRALMRACVELRDALTAGEGPEVGFWTPARLNGAACVASVVLADRELMARRMQDALMEGAGVQAVGPPERPGQEGVDYA